MQLDPYDALLDEYDPGMRRKDIDGIFGELESFLSGIIPAAAERAAQLGPLPEFACDFLVSDQTQLCKELMTQMGFDFNKGRLDVSPHPFCGGTRDDQRITTNYAITDPFQSLYGLIHESGHAAYEAGLPKEYKGQPVGNPRGMAMHESQSLFWEKQVGRSPAFAHYLAGLMQNQFPSNALQLTAENLMRLSANVKPSFIRIYADEVTYPMHILVRYEIEKDLIDGELEVCDLPEAFNQKMRNKLGITPPNDREGVLQDTHWPSGSIGYFPSYTIGAIAAAQLMGSVRKSISNLDDELRVGNLAPAMAWLRTNVHSKASSLSADEILQQATGEKLNPRFFRDHLTSRYLSK